MTKSIPYPPKNCELVFREPFPRKEISGGESLYWNKTKRDYVNYKTTKYHIRACIIYQPGIELPEHEIRIASQQQIQVMEQLVKEDGKLLNAVVKVENGKFVILKRSPQSDFFSLVRT